MCIEIIMQIEEVLHFTKFSYVENDGFYYKEYHHISNNDWDRIKQGCIAMAENGIAPKIVKIIEETETDSGRYIISESVNRFKLFKPEIRPKMTNEEIISAVRNQISKMHSLGYCHGDLHLESIGFKDNVIYIVDFDTIFKIKDPEEWVPQWMKEGFDWDRTFEEFVKYDYDKFISNWLLEF